MKTKFTSLIVFFLILYSLQVSANQTQGSGTASQGNTVFLVVPNAYSGTQGTATFLGPLANSQRTYQLLILADQLTNLTGSNLTGLSWRIPVSATVNWPPAEIIYSNYDIYLSGSVDPADRSLTFSENIVGTQTQVRSGDLRIPDSSYKSGNTPNEFGPEITFTTPWLYTGGNLLIEIRHLGSTGTSRSIDAIGTAVIGYGTEFSACWIGNYTGTVGLQGNFGVVKLSADSTLVGIHEPGIIPTEFKLDQNYPNPFNPVTKISFNIPVSDYVTLKIYDVMGREVAALINESLNSGSYEANWDASGLTSNIYFYRLTAGKFTETKSMMLVK